MTTLFIDTDRSYCGACNKNADPNETHHVMEVMQGDGCGAEFTELSSHYMDFEGLHRSIRKMRPDLTPSGLLRLTGGAS